MAVRKEKLNTAKNENQSSDATMWLRQHLDGMLIGLRTSRYSWWVHWSLLAVYVLPRRYLWLVTPNRATAGSPINDEIIDNTCTIAARTLASGMMSGITSPTRPWMRFTIGDHSLADQTPVKLWLDQVRDMMLLVMSESNYYTAKATQYLDLVVFGTAPMIIYEDFDDVIRCFNPAAGEYYCATDDKFRVNTFYREFTLTVPNVVQQFGLENCSPTVKAAYKSGGAQWRREIKIAHAIEPNDPVWTNENDSIEFVQVPKSFKWREVYWEWGQSQSLILGAKGYHDKPFSVPRWDVLANDAYGRSPAMDALGDTRQLQTMSKREAQAIEKHVNPPLVADVQLKNQPTSAVAGGINYVSNMSQHSGMRPIYEVQPDLNAFTVSKKEVQTRINNAMYVPLFTMISQLETVRTATEIDARREEKLIQLGPVLERLYNESLDADIHRIFAIMQRAQLIPPMPDEMRSTGGQIEIEYVSMLAQAQKAAATASIERLLQVIGNVSAVYPQAPDNIDIDETIDEYADMLGVPPRIVRSTIDVMKIRKDRATQQAQQQAMATAPIAADAAKTLSETDLGGGQNALSKILGTNDARQAA